MKFTGAMTLLFAFRKQLTAKICPGERLNTGQLNVVSRQRYASQWFAIEIPHQQKALCFVHFCTVRAFAYRQLRTLLV
jgi:hypothetical protein